MEWLKFIDEKIYDLNYLFAYLKRFAKEKFLFFANLPGYHCTCGVYREDKQ